MSSSQQAQPPQDQAATAIPAPDDVLAQIGGIESQFAAMRELVRKQAMMQLEIQRRQAQIDEQNLATAEQQTAIARERVELASKAGALEADRAALAALEQDLAARSEQLTITQESLAKARQALDQERQAQVDKGRELETAIRESAATLDADRAELARQRAAAQETAAGLAAEAARIEQLRASLAEQAQALALQREEVALARDGFDADAAAHQAQHQQELERLESLSALSGKERQELNELKDSLATREQELNARRDEQLAAFDTRQAQLAQDKAVLDARQGELDAKEAALAQLRDSLQAGSDQLAQREAQLERSLAEHKASAAAELEAQQAKLQERTAALAKLEAALGTERTALQAQTRALKERTDALARREDELAVAREDLHGQLAALEERRQRLEAVRKHNEATSAELAQRQDTLDALAAKIESRGTEPGSAQSSSAERTNAMLLEVLEEYEDLWRIERLHGAQLASRCDALSAATSQQQQSLTTSQQDLAELERVIEALKDRLKATALRVRELESQNPADAATVGAGNGPDAATALHLERRRARLKKYKDLVRRQAIKVRKAGEALTRRFEQVEQVMAMRADLAAARQRIIQAEKKELKHTAIARTLAPLAAILAIISLTGALSWAIAREVAPAHFAATAILKAEARDRSLNSGELAEWQKLHQNLLADPRLHESLADRYKRQGVLSLSAPGDVAELTKHDLTFESGADGELKLRLEGQGADATARTLEIFTNGLTNFVNSGSIRRVDGATTTIAQAAAAGPTPIDNIRTQYTLAMAGGGSLLCSGLAFLLWSRLSRAMTTFEKDTQLESLIESVPRIERDKP